MVQLEKKLTNASSNDVVAPITDQDTVQVADEAPPGDAGQRVRHGQPSNLEGCYVGTGTSTALPTEDEKSRAAESDLQEVIQQSEHEALQQEQADIAQAILESIREDPDGIVLRLTHHDAKIREALMTAEVLASCRSRVTEAGCELSPAWGNGALFLLPFREEAKFQELQLQAIMLEHLKPYNIVALREDERLIKEALADVPRRRRPHCKHEGSGSAGSTNAIGQLSGACDNTSGGTSSLESENLPSSAELWSDIKIEIERTFYTAKAAYASSASSICNSAPW